MSLILIEGPDGGGKTQTAKTVFADHHYQHNGPPSPGNSPSDTFWWQLEGLLQPIVTEVKDISSSSWYQHETLATNWIVDRNWPSEQIYHRFAGRPHVFHPFAQRMFERYMLAHQGVVVMCLPPFGVARAAWRKRVEEGRELVADEFSFATMYEFYRTWESSLPIVKYDYTENGSAWLKKAVYYQRKYTTKNPYPSVVYGNPGANILIVGEQYNVNGRPQGPHIPFVGTGRNGFWLTKQLEIAGLREKDLAWVNCLTPNGLKVSPEIITQLQPRVIIALGSKAAAWSRFFSKATVLQIPHPAYWTRFKSGDEYPLHEHALFLQETARDFF